MYICSVQCTCQQKPVGNNIQLLLLFLRYYMLLTYYMYTNIMIDWCLMPTLAIFQLYRGVNKFYYNLRHLQDP